MWRLAGNQASWRSDRFSVNVDALRPAKGLSGVRVGRTPLPRGAAALQVLQVRTRPESPDEPEVLVERYVRGADLVATYAQTPHRRVCPQVYWRVLDAGDAVGVELVISIETSLLQSEPQLTVGSVVGATEVWRLGVEEGAELRRVAAGDREGVGGDGPGLFLFRLDGDEYSYLEMAHPSDLSQVRLSFPAECAESVLTWDLFGGALEKGVIRRARVRGLFVRREGDRKAAADWRQRLSTASPPLTA